MMATRGMAAAWAKVRLVGFFATRAAWTVWSSALEPGRVTSPE